MGTAGGVVVLQSSQQQNLQRTGVGWAFVLLYFELAGDQK